MSNSDYKQTNPERLKALKASQEAKHEDAALRYLSWYWRERSFFRKYVWAAVMVAILCLLANITSVATALTFVVTQVEAWAGGITAWIFAGIFLIAWEGIKYINYEDFWKEYYGEAVVLKYSNAPTLISLDSVAARYDSEINAINEKIAVWQGRIAATDDWTARAKTLPALEAEAAKLRDQRALAMAKAEEEKTEIIKTSDKFKRINASTVAYASIAADFILLFGAWFLVWFRSESMDDFMLSTQNEAADPGMPEATPAGQHRILTPTERLAAAKLLANTETLPRNTETPIVSTASVQAETHEVQAVQLETPRNVSAVKPEVETEPVHTETKVIVETIDLTKAIRDCRNWYRRNDPRYEGQKKLLEKLGYIVKPENEKTLSITKQN